MNHIREMMFLAKERNLYRTCILFSNPNKILFKSSNHPFYLTQFFSVGDFKMRLQGGPNKKEGRVEIMYKGRWWSICDSNWDMASAIVVCRQLGYGAARPLYDKYASKTRHFLVDHTRCNGSESNIFDCESDAWNTDGGASTVTCPDKYQGAAVQCEPPGQYSRIT